MGRAFEYRRASKEKRWGMMSRVFPKIIRTITMACREAGSDPASNAKLRTAIAYAKTQNMPKDNIDNAIKRATSKDAQDFQETTFEGKGPHGVFLFIECATDNNTRTVANVKTILNKNGGEMLESGSLSYMFDRKAVVEFTRPESPALDEIELELIDAGLEELAHEEGSESISAIGEYSSFSTLTAACEALGLEIRKASLQRLPKTPVEFTEEQMDDIEALLDKLEDDDDVQIVYTNID